MSEVSALFPPWARFLFQPARYKCAFGGRGSSKSWSFARYLIALAYSSRQRILCARELQTSIAESVHQLLCNQIDMMGLGAWFRIQQQGIFCPHNGSEFFFYGVRNNVTKLKSTEGITRCWVEEAEKISADSWQILIPTIREPNSEILISFNPDEESDPTYQRFVVNTPPDCIAKEVNYRDNPWFPEVLRKEKDYLARVDPEAYAHVWGGQCRRNTSAQIFKGKYVIEAFTPPRPGECDAAQLWDGPYYGADWGFSQDPTVLIKFWISGYDAPHKQLFIERESWGVGVELDDIVAKWRRDVPDIEAGALVRADSSRPETISHVSSHGVKFGLRVQPAEKWSGSVEDGVAWLRSFEQIIISPDCPHTAQEFRLYSYKRDRLTGDVLTDIVDKDNHSIDGLRYGAEPLIRATTSLGIWARLAE